MDDQQLKSAIEALLFIGGAPLTADRLKGIFEDVPKERIEEQLRQLKAEYEARGAGVMLAEVAGGWQLATCPDQAAWVRKFKTVKVTARLSRPALETLAIIAYKQPVTRPEIEAIRGVNSDSPLDTLVQYELACEAGRKDTPGRPVLYRTTDSFLGHFGLNSIADLPGLDTIPVELPPEALAEAEAAPQGEEGTVVSDSTEGGEALPPVEEAQEPTAE